MTFSAAGVSFYSMLSAFPAAIATISIYGLFADPDTLAAELEGIAEVLPSGAAQLVIDELEALASGPRLHLGFGALVSILVALWSASSALRALSVALDQTYGVGEPRPYIVQRLLSYVLTLGFIVGLVVQGVLVAATPGWLRANLVAETVRWPLLYAVLVIGVAVLYRVAPNRPWAQSRWGIPGSLVAATGVLVATGAISVYGRHADRLNSTYGVVAGVVLLMLWFYVAIAAVLIGAEVDAAQHR
jgi:membrane protein